VLTFIVYHQSPYVIAHSESAQPILGKASMRRNGYPLLSSENAAQNRQVLSQRARFKAAYSSLHEFERAAQFLHSHVLIKLL
jgi:hypothetical protein